MLCVNEPNDPIRQLVRLRGRHYIVRGVTNAVQLMDTLYSEGTLWDRLSAVDIKAGLKNTAVAAVFADALVLIESDPHAKTSLEEGFSRYIAPYGFLQVISDVARVYISGMEKCGEIMIRIVIYKEFRKILGVPGVISQLADPEESYMVKNAVNGARRMWNNEYPAMPIT